MTEQADQATVDRLRGNLQLKAKAIDEAEKDLEVLRAQRRTLILEARDKGALTYVEMAKAAGLSKPQVYKIVRDGYSEPPLRGQAEAEPEASLA